MHEKKTTRVSKRISYVLRHAPETIGLVLDDAGWAGVDDLIGRLRISREALDEVVETNNKKRFEFSDDGRSIRARQGHSVDVELGYRPSEPPDLLFHGTADRNLESIRERGLHRAARHHVHLSTNESLMLEVGRRHGKPVVVTVDAKRMRDDGHQFFITENEVWLTEAVPPEYLIW
jgi:putative RNA 2'-phosphotransferase